MDRRDFINGTVIGAVAAWSGRALAHDTDAVRETGAQPRWGGNPSEVFEVAHGVRDGRFARPDRVRDTREQYDVAIIGAGLSGLAAAYTLQRLSDGRLRILLLDNHEVLGGAAQVDEFCVGGRTLLGAQGSIVSRQATVGLTTFPDAPAFFRDVLAAFDGNLVPHMERGFGTFRAGLDSGAPALSRSLAESPIPPAVRDQYFAFLTETATLYENPGWRQALADADALTFRTYIERRGWSRSLYDWMLPELASFFGLPDHVSAAAVLRQYGGGPPVVRSHPGGNSAIARSLLAAIRPDAMTHDRAPTRCGTSRRSVATLDGAGSNPRVRLGATAVHIVPADVGLVRVTYCRGNRLDMLRARAVIMAGGAFMTQHVLADLPVAKREAFQRLVYAPIVWANVALANASAYDAADPPFLTMLGGTRASLLLAYEKQSAAGWNPGRDPARPVLLGLSLPFRTSGPSARPQAAAARAELLGLPFSTLERWVLDDLQQIFGPFGLNARRDVAALSICRWGHGYVLPDPGLLSGGALQAAAAPLGRIAFANSDLDGFSHVDGALGHGHRAAREVLAMLAVG
jgi:spermidine dehydrogenase